MSNASKLIDDIVTRTGLLKRASDLVASVRQLEKQSNIAQNSTNAFKKFAGGPGSAPVASAPAPATAPAVPPPVASTPMPTPAPRQVATPKPAPPAPASVPAPAGSVSANLKPSPVQKAKAVVKPAVAEITDPHVGYAHQGPSASAAEKAYQAKFNYAGQAREQQDPNAGANAAMSEAQRNSGKKPAATDARGVVYSGNNVQ